MQSPWRHMQRGHTTGNGHPGTSRNTALGSEAPAGHEGRTQTKPGLCPLARPPLMLPVHPGGTEDHGEAPGPRTDEAGVRGQQGDKDQEEHQRRQPGTSLMQVPVTTQADGQGRGAGAAGSPPAPCLGPHHTSCHPSPIRFQEGDE